MNGCVQARSPKRSAWSPCPTRSSTSRAMRLAGVAGQSRRASSAARWVTAFRPSHGVDEWAARPCARRVRRSPSCRRSNVTPCDGPAPARSSAASSGPAPSMIASAAEGTRVRASPPVNDARRAARPCGPASSSGSGGTVRKIAPVPFSAVTTGVLGVERHVEGGWVPRVQELAKRRPVRFLGQRNDELDPAPRRRADLAYRTQGVECGGDRRLVVLGPAADEPARLARRVERERIAPPPLPIRGLHVAVGQNAQPFGRPPPADHDRRPVVLEVEAELAARGRQECLHPPERGQSHVRCRRRGHRGKVHQRGQGRDRGIEVRRRPLRGGARQRGRNGVRGHGLCESTGGLGGILVLSSRNVTVINRHA